MKRFPLFIGILPFLFFSCGSGSQSQESTGPEWLQKIKKIEKEIAFEAEAYKSEVNQQGQKSEWFKAKGKYSHISQKKFSYPNGNPLALGWVVGEKAYGTWTWWHEDDMDPKIKRVQTYNEDGLLEGVEYYYYWDGTKQAEIPFLAGKRHGVAYTWRENGIPDKEVHYMNGEKVKEVDL